MLVIAPAGNNGSAGPSFGNIGGPGGAPAALTVGAADGRPATPTVRVFVRAGLRVLYDGEMPLGGAPGKTVTATIVPVSRQTAQKGISALFDGGVSIVAGRAALLAQGAHSEETVEEATTAGAVAVLGDGPIPAGAFSLDVPTGVPVVGLPDGLALTMQALLASGIPVTVSIGAVGVAANGEGGAIATFSSRGLAFGGIVKPELVAPGVAVPTSEPGRGQDGEVRFGTVSGTSVAAAVTAGAAAVWRRAPACRGDRAAGLLVGSAKPLESDSTAAGAGLLDLRSAVQQEIVAEPSAISSGDEEAHRAGDRADVRRAERLCAAAVGLDQGEGHSRRRFADRRSVPIFGSPSEQASRSSCGRTRARFRRTRRPRPARSRSRSAARRPSVCRGVGVPVAERAPDLEGHAEDERRTRLGRLRRTCRTGRRRGDPRAGAAGAPRRPPRRPALAGRNCSASSRAGRSSCLVATPSASPGGARTARGCGAGATPFGSSSDRATELPPRP